MARINARLRPRARDWDRFAHWAPGAAIAVLAGFALLLVAAALSQRSDLPLEPAPPIAAPSMSAPAETSDAPDSVRDTDLLLYDRIAERVDNGENYYTAAVTEQRARDFPVRPGLAVRLPTLAFLTAWLEPWGMTMLAVVLVAATLLAWWVRLRDEPGGNERLVIVLLLLVIGIVAGVKPQYLALHEVWAGLLVALSLGLHRPASSGANFGGKSNNSGDGKWLAAWLVAAIAVAIREHALPFVLLMGALGWWRGDRREAVAWAGLALLFVIALAVHLSLVSAVTTPADPASPGWLALRGLGGWTSNIVNSGPLHLLPGWLAAPLALLPLLGWAGWRSSLGQTGFFLCLGYGVMFMIAGRDNNFYWALVVMPVWFIGFAFLPQAVASLWHSARGI